MPGSLPASLPPRQLWSSSREGKPVETLEGMPIQTPEECPYARHCGNASRNNLARLRWAPAKPPPLPTATDRRGQLLKKKKNRPAVLQLPPTTSSTTLERAPDALSFFSSANGPFPPPLGASTTGTHPDLKG